MLYALWALAGWCGTPYPGWRPGRKGPRPDPDPQPWLVKVVAVIGGLLGGWAVERLFTAQETGPALVAATLVGALIGGRVLGDLASLALGGAHNAPDVAAHEVVGR